MSFQESVRYAGDITVEDAYKLLADDRKAVLVDVRTQPEWAFVGVPDLTGLDKAPIFAEWQIYPEMQVAADFAPRLSAALEARATDRAAPVLFLCRSGARSRAAAAALTASGWSRCYNIADGFEGVLDGGRKRGTVGGWKACGLPWTQS